MKKLTLGFIIVGVLVLSGYFVLHHSLNTKGFKPATVPRPGYEPKTAESVADLRPKLIARLQQLVKQKSGGLYNLSIHEIEPDILASTLDIKNLELGPDTGILKSLEDSGKRPADIFKIKLDEVRLEGIGIDELLKKDQADLLTIFIDHPLVEVYHNAQKTGKKTVKRNLYQRLSGQMKHLSIGKIVLRGGTLIKHDLQSKKVTSVNDISIILSSLLMDSSTQYDRSRFLFAKEAEISMRDFVKPSADNLYQFKIGSFSISTSKNLMTVKDFAMEPRFSKQDFQKKLRAMKERYEISVPSIQLKKIKWWDLLNDKSFEAATGEIGSARVSVYLDRSLPERRSDLSNFPHQLIMALPFQLNVARFAIQHTDVTYEEFNPASGETGSFHLGSLHGSITNLTNMSTAIKRNHQTSVNASGLIMNKVPADLWFRFDLSKYVKGNFAAGLKTKGFDATIINPVAAPIAMFKIKRGEVRELRAEISGNNYNASGKVLLLYDKLHITPLEKSDKPKELGKRNFTSFLANILVIRNENPTGNKAPRIPVCSFRRDPHGSFFNLVWKTTFVGIIETIGAPVKLAN